MSHLSLRDIRGAPISLQLLQFELQIQIRFFSGGGPNRRGILRSILGRLLRELV